MFDSTEELLRQIRLGEDSVLELKRVGLSGGKVRHPKRSDLADELAAIANSHHGVCVLGVDDETREILGIPVEDLDAAEAFVREICNDLIKPSLQVRILRLELPDTLGQMRPVLKIDIPSSLFVHKSPGGYFHRQGSSKRELSTEQLARLLQQRSQARLIRFEEQSVPETGADSLEEDLWRRFLGPFSEEPRETLHKLRLLSADDEGIERATVAGVLMCSEHPEEWLPGAQIEAVRYRGVVQDSNYQVDASSITGSLDQQIRHAVAFVHRVMRVSAVKIPERREIPQFSLRAVFEAVVNAVAHRDYSIHGSRIRLFIFDDRLELYSPGTLPNSVTIESLPLRQSTRNELLTSLLAKCPVDSQGSRQSSAVQRRYLMEKRGDGVPIILRESQELSGKRPVYRLIDDAELLLTIFSAEQIEDF